MSAKDSVNVYELIIFNPLMAREFKCSFSVSQTNLLLMCLLVENALVPSKEKTEQLAALLNEEITDRLLKVLQEMLKKGEPGLLEYYESIKLLTKSFPLSK